MRDWSYRGAYTGEGTNDGWHLAIEKKPPADTVSSGIRDATALNFTVNAYVFPNPSQESVQLEFDRHLPDVSIYIIDVDGQVHHQYNGSLQRTQLDISELTPGIYFMQIRTSGFAEILKLVRAD